jgi:hypothetical protein
VTTLAVLPVSFSLIAGVAWALTAMRRRRRRSALVTATAESEA